ncbi:MAG: hypothetical protein H0V73_04185 [Chloroflexi bacterium]|nr:hypothetical protein [Chloroflexota bacterium]
MRDLTRRVAAINPAWTDRQDEDPGVELVELFAFLAESLVGRTAVSERALARLREVLRQLEAGRAVRCTEPSTPTRVRFFAGQVLSAADLEVEQSYHRSKERRHNLLLHGSGIVRGLEVTVQGGLVDDQVIAVMPGVAIGPDGEEIIVCERLTSVLCSDEGPCYVTLRVMERPDHVVPTATGEEASRIVEVPEVAVIGTVTPGHLAIARVERVDDLWTIDATFTATRLSR